MQFGLAILARESMCGLMMDRSLRIHAMNSSGSSFFLALHLRRKSIAYVHPMRSSAMGIHSNFSSTPRLFKGDKFWPQMSITVL